MMREFLRDLRFGTRQLLQRPGFSAAAIASLALGLGLNTTLFSIVNAVLLRATPVAEPDRLVEIYTGPSQEYAQLTLSYPDYLDLRSHADTLESVAAHAFVRGILSSGDRPSLVTGETVSDNYFSVLGIPPALGRGFVADEHLTPGAAPVVVIGHGLWQRQFGGRPDVIGQAIQLSGVEYTVVGVAPAPFTGTIPGLPTDFWVPIVMADRLEFSGVQWSTDVNPGATRLERRGSRWLFVKARLASGRSIDEARAQVESLFEQLRAEHPATNDKLIASVVRASDIRFHPMLDGYVRAASAVLLVAVGLVLLIACANVANLLLARGTARQRELAIRSAIGASRGRIVRQLLSEGVVLAGAGGLAGTVLAWWAGRALSGFGTDLLPMPVAFDFSIDTTVLFFAFSVSAATALLFGLAPAWSASRLELVPALKAGATGAEATSRARGVTLRDALVVGQLALSVVLLVAGALLARGLFTARGTSIGFDPGPVSSLSFNLQMNGYDVDRAMAFRERAVHELGSLPGVVAVSVTSRLPLAPDINMEGVRVPGHHGPDDDATPIDTVAVGAGYFSVVGVQILAGRAFTEDDLAQQRRVAVVNETMARRYWPDGSAVGRLIHTEGFDQPAHEVVGVARDHAVRSVGEAQRPYLHLPAGRSRQIGLIVKTATPAPAALPMLRASLRTLEPALVFTEDAPATAIVEATLAPTRIGALTMGAFGALALLLAAVGLYGVIAYSVSLRTKEIGVRVALGAARGQVLAHILRQGARLAIVGLAIGGFASLGLGRLLESLLYGVSRVDPVAYAVAGGLLLLVATAANLIPALSAARIDPVRALRSE